MVERPDELVVRVTFAKQRHAVERRLGHGKAALAVGPQKLIEPDLAPRRRQRLQVLLVPFQPHVRVDDLRRLVAPFPAEAGSQSRVAVHRPLPRALKRRHVQAVAQPVNDLLDVNARVLGIEVVKQHALL